MQAPPQMQLGHGPEPPATQQDDSDKIFVLVLELTNPDQVLLSIKITALQCWHTPSCCKLPCPPPSPRPDSHLSLSHPASQFLQRESALLELSKRRETFADLAPILWHSFGTVSALLQEIVAIYPLLAPPSLTAQASNRVCNALALLQCVASHPETRTLFLNAHIPLFLYPFLNTVSKTRPFEYLRLTSLGVIGALVKVCAPRLVQHGATRSVTLPLSPHPRTPFPPRCQVDDADVINFLLSTEIIPLCLRIMETVCRFASPPADRFV